jgi:hypothetical protein
MTFGWLQQMLHAFSSPVAFKIYSLLNHLGNKFGFKINVCLTKRPYRYIITFSWYRSEMVHDVWQIFLIILEHNAATVYLFLTRSTKSRNRAIHKPNMQKSFLFMFTTTSCQLELITMIYQDQYLSKLHNTYHGKYI